MNWRTRLFGPSTTDRLLDVLSADRAARSKEVEGQTALLVSLVEGVRAQSALAQKQLDLLTAPTEKPVVRLMTPVDEARYERERGKHANRVAPKKSVNVDALLASLSADFAAEARQ